MKNTIKQNKIIKSNKYIILGIFVFAILFISVYKIAFGLGLTATITATPTSIAPDGTSLIKWTSTNAESCLLSGGGITGSGTSNSTGVPTNPISIPTTYTIDCEGTDGMSIVSKSVTVTVTAGLPTIPIFTATPSSITSGQNSSIHWESAGATSCSSAGGGGTGTTGTFTTPVLTTNTTYTVNCTNSYGTTPKNVLVTVAPAGNGGGGGGPGVPTVTVTANPSSTTASGNSNINWTSTGADSCISAGGGGTGTTGNFLTPSLTTTTAYSVSCNKNGFSCVSDYKNYTPPKFVALCAGQNTEANCVATEGSPIAGDPPEPVCSWESSILTGTNSATVTVTSSGGGGGGGNGGGNPSGVPIVTVTANPSSVYYSNTSLVSWSSNGINDVCLSSAESSNSTGSFSTPPLSSTKTYTVTCESGNDYNCKKNELVSSGNLCRYPTRSGCEGAEHPVVPEGGGQGYMEKLCQWIPKEGVTPRAGTGSATITVIPPEGANLGWITDVMTKNATNITDTQANLQGSLNPGGTGALHTADAYFRYSSIAPDSVSPIFCNNIYGSNMKATMDIPVSGNTSIPFSISVGDLYPDTDYYYCLVGSNDNQIAYGGVKKFTTKMSSWYDPNSQDDKFSITTNSATVVDGTSAYLNGSYNSTIISNTWFEYRKKSSGKGQNNIISTPAVSFFENLFNFKINKALALTSNDGAIESSDIYNWSKKIDEKIHKKNTNGTLSFLLKGLRPSTVYEFRAVIYDPVTYLTDYGVISSFTTKSVRGDGNDNDPGGSGYKDPCAGVLNDINCNGNSGGGNGGGINTINLPDLTAGVVTLSSSTTINASVILSSTIINQGDASTIPLPIIKGGSGINNVIPTKIINVQAGGVSFLNNFFGTKKALALSYNTDAVNGTSNSSSSSINANSNTSTTSTNGDFYNFFQVSTINPNSIDSTTNMTSKIINLPAVSMSALGPKSSMPTKQNYTFPSFGTYYIRACADKKNPIDIGLIKESYENNNCGQWTTIIIGLNSGLGNNGGSGVWNNGNGNGNGTLSTTTKTENLATNPSNLKIGDNATAPDLAIVRYHEGIETVLQRQIVANTELAKSYGYQDGGNLESFAWTLADILAKTFGYVGSNRKEIRVSRPDIAAYQLYINNGILTVYEYYDGEIVNIQKMTDALRSKYDYEYYFNK